MVKKVFFNNKKGKSVPKTTNIKLKIYAEEHNDHISVNEYKGDYGFRIVGLCTSCKKTFDFFMKNNS